MKMIHLTHLPSHDVSDQSDSYANYSERICELNQPINFKHPNQKNNSFMNQTWLLLSWMSWGEIKSLLLNPRYWKTCIIAHKKYRQWFFAFVCSLKLERFSPPSFYSNCLEKSNQFFRIFLQFFRKKPERYWMQLKQLRLFIAAFSVWQNFLCKERKGDRGGDRERQKAIGRKADGW